MVRESDFNAISNDQSDYNNIGDHRDPAKEESSTTLFELIRELMKELV
jgi:hypothetical protein